MLRGNALLDGGRGITLDEPCDLEEISDGLEVDREENVDDGE